MLTLGESFLLAVAIRKGEMNAVGMSLASAAQLRQLAEPMVGIEPPRRFALKPTGAPAVGLALLLPVDGRLSSPFGMRLHPTHNDWRQHRGIDLAVPVGTAVHAAAAGTVSSVRRRSGYGLTVILDHGGGAETLYAHLQSVSVNVGDNVDAGAVIALSGTAGTGPHVHLELRVDGEAVDPVPLVQQPQG